MTIYMPETGYAVCNGVPGQVACFWSASGPNSVQAALAHDIEFGDHQLWVGTNATAVPWSGREGT